MCYTSSESDSDLAILFDYNSYRPLLEHFAESLDTILIIIIKNTHFMFLMCYISIYINTLKIPEMLEAIYLFIYLFFF